MTFWIIAIALTLLTLAALLLPQLKHRGQASTPTAVSITAILIGLPVCVVLLYRLVGDYSSAIDARPQADSAAGNAIQGAPDIAGMVAGLAARLQENPEDLEGWLMLGRSYVALERFEDAREAYQRAYLLSGGQNLTATLGYAEALVLTDQTTLSGEAAVLLETVLKMAPQNPKALWYGGMSARARGENDLASQRWQLLLRQELPDQVRLVVQQQLASLGGSVPPGPSTDTTGPAATSLTIDVEITVTGTLRDRIEGGEPLFVVARDPDQPGPPIAVVRQTAGDLPATISITDANLMLPGRSLADLPRLRLIARIAGGGDPIAQPGDLFGEVLWDQGQGPVHIVIDSVVE